MDLIRCRYFRGPLNLSCGSGGEFTNFCDIGFRMTEPEEARFGIRLDGRERLTHLVRDGGREFAQHRHSGGMGDIRLDLGQHVLCLHPIADIDEAHETRVLFTVTGPNAAKNSASMTVPSSVTILSCVS